MLSRCSKQGRLMDFKDVMQKVYPWVAQIGNPVVQLLWHFIHFSITIWYFALSKADLVESYLVSSGFLKSYRALQTGKLQCLAVVIDSDEAYQILKVIEILKWLAEIGVKHVCLYDIEGILKKSKESILEKLNNARLFGVISSEDDKNELQLDQNHITLELASLCDGKEAIAKAANFLFINYLNLYEPIVDQAEKIFTEAQMAEALKAVGSGGPEPELLLVYGPTRCHLGFPAWRIRYTEIIHMGPLKSMKYGSFAKAIYNFKKVHQKFGT